MHHSSTQHSTRTPYDIQERSFLFACRIVRLHQYLCKQGDTQREIGKQVLRSGTSIGANLQEAHAGQSKPDFISKSAIALKEARETYFWLRLLCETHLVAASRIMPLVHEADEIIAILTSILKTARSSQ